MLAMRELELFQILAPYLTLLFGNFIITYCGR